MPQFSIGILLYRQTYGACEVLLVHPGGPFWARKDEGAWSIPKGLVEPGEDRAAAARREFIEETGHDPQGDPEPLGEFRQPGGKRVVAFLLEGDFVPSTLKSNTFELEWPPHSGRRQVFPEVDRAQWFSLEEAGRKLLKGQVPILEALSQRLRR